LVDLLPLLLLCLGRNACQLVADRPPVDQEVLLEEGIITRAQLDPGKHTEVHRNKTLVIVIHGGEAISWL
jgi:hypothetical protein